MISFVIISGGARPASLQRLLRSLEKQGDSQIIVVGSCPVPLPSGAVYIQREDLASEAAICKMRNIGARAAAGDPIVLLDDDMELSDGWSAAAMETIDKGFDIAGCSVVTPAGDRWYDWCWASRRDPSCPPRLMDYGETSPNAYVSGCMMIIRRRVFDKVTFNENLLNHQRDDVDFCHRARDAGFSIGIIPHAVAVHHLDPAGRSSDDPASGSGWFSKGINLFRLKKYSEAIECFRRADGAGERVKSVYHQALCLVNMGRRGEARELFTHVARDAAPSGADRRLYYSARFHLGAIFEADGDFLKARGCYGEALEGFPEHLEARRGLERTQRGEAV